MTSEEKELLIEDTIGRIPYKVKILTCSYDKITNKEIQVIETLYQIDADGYINTIEDDWLRPVFKPYLFPLSSMTEEQRKEFLEISHLENRSFYNGEEIVIVSNEVWAFDLGGDADTEYRSIDIKRIRETIKWLNKNHFDWRGLIPMGLAEDATNKNIY